LPSVDGSVGFDGTKSYSTLLITPSSTSSSPAFPVITTLTWTGSHDGPPIKGEASRCKTNGQALLLSIPSPPLPTKNGIFILNAAVEVHDSSRQVTMESRIDKSLLICHVVLAFSLNCQTTPWSKSTCSKLETLQIHTVGENEVRLAWFEALSTKDLCFPCVTSY